MFTQNLELRMLQSQEPLRRVSLSEI